MEDRTHRKRAEAQIARLVHHDLLTGLPNRAAFTACIDATIETAAKDGHSVRADVPRSRPLQGGQRRLRTRRRRRTAAPVVQAPASRGRRRLPGAAWRRRVRRDRHRWRTARRRRSSWRSGCSPRSAKTSTSTANRCASASASASPSSRSTAPTPPRWSPTPTPRFIRAKAEGARRVPLLRSRHGQAAARAARAAAGPAIGDRAQRAWPCIYQPQARISGEVFGFEALVRWQHPQARHDPGRHLHSARRGKRADRRRSANGSCARRAGRRRPGPTRCRSRSTCRRCSSATAICVKLVHAVLLETGLPPVASGARDHRGRADRRFLARGFDPAPAQGAGRAHRHGRFRHRLFLAVLFAVVPVRQDQDRPVLHLQSWTATRNPPRSSAR